MKENTQPMIVMTDLTKRYPSRKYLALDNIDLSINEGEFFGLLGPNGSGKTTLISILCGLIKQTTGKIIMAGQPIPQEIQKIKPLINLVPQEIALYPTLTLVENIIFFAKIYGICSSMLQERIQESLDMSGLSEVAHQLIETFSGGMQRRANLIISLINHPRILFLDEPAAHVDPQSRAFIFKILRDLNQKGVTIIYTTHYLEEAEALCSRVAILDNGHILCQDTPQNLMRHNKVSNLSGVFFKLTGKEWRHESV